MINRVLISKLPVLFAVLSLASVALADDQKPGWQSEAEAGVVVTSGNTDTSTVTAKENTSYRFDNDLFKLFGAYLYQKTGEAVSAKNWSLGLRYERIVSDRLSFFLGETAEGDRFKGLLQSYNTDIGAKYYMVKEDELYWFGEGGYRFTRENALTYHKNKNFLRAYTEVEKKFTPTTSMKYWIEYLPNLTSSSDWQANTELSMSSMLTNIFSIKIAYLVRYDNVPNEPGLKKSDRGFTTALVAKF